MEHRGLLREGRRVDIYRFIHTENAEFNGQTLGRVLGVLTCSLYDSEQEPQLNQQFLAAEPNSVWVGDVT